MVDLDLFALDCYSVILNDDALSLVIIQVSQGSFTFPVYM